MNASRTPTNGAESPRPIIAALRELLANRGHEATISFQLPIGPAETYLPGMPIEEGPPIKQRGRISHAADWSTVNWYGQVFSFTPKQRPIVAALWDAREDGTDFVTNSMLLELCETSQERLRDLFRGNPAWGTLIVQGQLHGGRVGTYRLAPGPVEAAKAGVA